MRLQWHLGRPVGNANPNPPNPANAPPHSPTLVLVAVGIFAAANILYLSLLITCDVLRVAPRGFVPRFENERVTVSNVEPESPADRAGLVAGDRLVRMNGQVLLGRADWQRASIQFDPSEPLVLDVERHGERLTVTLALSAGLTEWQRGKQTSGLLAFRLAQAVTLLLGIAVAFRRSSQLSALLGSLFLGSLGTVSLVLPMRLGVFWQALPEPVESLL